MYPCTSCNKLIQKKVNGFENEIIILGCPEIIRSGLTGATNVQFMTNKYRYLTIAKYKFYNLNESSLQVGIAQSTFS